MGFTKVAFTKDWNNPSDFKTVETSEIRVREDIQFLHDQMKDQVNRLIDELDEYAETVPSGEQYEEDQREIYDAIHETVLGQIPDGTITTPKIADGAVTESKIAPSYTESILNKATPKVSMNAPTAADNIAAGYPIGKTWLRPNYTLTNLVYDLDAADFSVSSCVVSENARVFTFAGNGDDKAFSAEFNHSSASGWLHFVVTPDATAASANMIIGGETVALIVGETNTIQRRYTGESIKFEATYATANAASTGTIVLANYIVVDESATLEQVSENVRDVTSETVYKYLALMTERQMLVPSDGWAHMKDGVWEKSFAVLPHIIVNGESSTVSTVICVKDNITLTAEPVDGVWTFNIPEYGEWRVIQTIADGVEREEVVLVDTAKEYIVQTMFPLNYIILYDNGEEFTEETGGWDGYALASGASGVNIGFMGKKKLTNDYIAVAAKAGVNVQTTSYTASAGFTVSSPFSGNIATIQNGDATGTYTAYKVVAVTPPGELFYPMFWTRSNGTLSNVSTQVKKEENRLAWYHSYYTNSKQYNKGWSYGYFYAALKADNWQELCKRAGVGVSADMASLLADATKLAKILANREAVIYMLNVCTGFFMASATVSSTFMTALNASAYKELVYANEHWAKFLAVVA